MLLYEVSIRLLFNNSGFEGGVFAWLFLRVAPGRSDSLGCRYSVRKFVEPGREHINWVMYCMFIELVCFDGRTSAREFL